MFNRNLLFWVFVSITHLSRQVSGDCRDYTFEDCNFANGPFETAKDLDDASICQQFCALVYTEDCTFFVWDRINVICELYDYNMTDYLSSCKTLGGSPSPGLEACEEYVDKCMEFREGYCNFDDASLLENYPDITTVQRCEFACKLNSRCEYFIYSGTDLTCQLHSSKEESCDLIVGPPTPSQEEACKPFCPEQCTDEAHGTCDITTGICNCVDGFGGENCASILCPDDCTDQAHGTCDFTTGNCNCADGFAGENCAGILCPDDCTDAAHGLCDLTTGICSCMDGYAGENCAASSRIMVTSGNSLVTEVIDITDETKKCNNLGDFPVLVGWATGGLVDGKPIICGGQDDATHTYKQECYIFEDNAWILLTSLNEPRSQAGSTVLNGDHLWITGGETPGMYIKTSEKIWANGTVLSGPELPSALNAHCMVNLHNGSVLILGAGAQTSNADRKEVWMLNKETGTVNTFSDTILPRHHPGCTLFNSPKHDYRPVVYVGGGCTLSGATSEVLDYTVTDTWEQIADFPGVHREYFWGGRALPTPSGNGVIFISSAQKIFELGCDADQCTWSTKQQQLSSPHVNWPVAMYIDPSLTTCA